MRNLAWLPHRARWEVEGDWEASLRPGRQVKISPSFARLGCWDVGRAREAREDEQFFLLSHSNRKTGHAQQTGLRALTRETGARVVWYFSRKSFHYDCLTVRLWGFPLFPLNFSFHYISTISTIHKGRDNRFFHHTDCWDFTRQNPQLISSGEEAKIACISKAGGRRQCKIVWSFIWSCLAWYKQRKQSDPQMEVGWPTLSLISSLKQRKYFSSFQLNIASNLMIYSCLVSNECNNKIMWSRINNKICSRILTILKCQQSTVDIEEKYYIIGIFTGHLKIKVFFQLSFNFFYNIFDIIFSIKDDYMI